MERTRTGAKKLSSEFSGAVGHASNDLHEGTARMPRRRAQSRTQRHRTESQVGRLFIESPGDESHPDQPAERLRPSALADGAAAQVRRDEAERGEERGGERVVLAEERAVRVRLLGEGLPIPLSPRSHLA